MSDDLNVTVPLNVARGGIAALNRLALGFTLTMEQRSDCERLRSAVQGALEERTAGVRARQRVPIITHWLDALPVSYLADAANMVDHAKLSEEDIAALERVRVRLEAVK
ncbi:MAG: hypothetical protein HC933_03835 [Pleurocapsa sp. SU_196_0]|nr:hypothetical protein [Pleurocapsa sp. SU_196_0]